MFSKQAAVISTAAGAGMKSAIKDVADSCFFWGIPRIYKYGKAVRAVSWEKVKPEMRRDIEKKTDNIASKVKHNQGRKSVPLKTYGFFMLMRMMQKNGFNETDAKYWTEKGWTGKVRPWKG